MIHYILQTIVFQLLFLIIYDLFLKKETFFNWNRAYLLVTAILSLTIPFIKVQQINSMVTEPMVVRLPEVIIGQSQPAAISQDLALQAGLLLKPEPMMSWWQLVFICGMAIALVLFFIKLFRIFKLRTNNPKRWKGNVLLVNLLNSRSAFSFFNTIFLGSDLSSNEQSSILKHEMVHVNDRHSIDLLFFEMLRIVFWFNPLVYLYQMRMTTLHEYIADADAVKVQNKKSYYESLLSQVFDHNQISFVNPFFKNSLIKKRIKMLSRNKSKQLNLLKYSLLLPMILAMLFYVSCSKQALDIDETPINLEQFSYELERGENSIPTEIKTTHDKFETFLKENKNYVAWATVESDKISYTVHPRLEPVLEGYTKLVVQFSNEESYDMYINLPNESVKYGESGIVMIDETVIDEQIEVPFAVVEKVPFPNTCRDLPTNNEQKSCMSEFIQRHVNRNFNKDLPASLGLTGHQRINVIFKINTEGNVVDVKSRAGHPGLEAEAIRVIELLPQFEPGVQKGKKVTVPYSLPILFEVAEKSESANPKQMANNQELIEVPYAVVDVAPTSEKCMKLATESERRKCFSSEIHEFVGNNFNQNLAKQNDLNGTQRVNVIFKIGKDGIISNIRSRARHPALEAEAIRVVKLLPQFIPGKQDGKNTVVPYSLPIIFEVN